MGTISYLYSKIFKKYLRGKSIRDSIIDSTSLINSGSSILNSSIGKYSYCGYDCEINHAIIGNYCSLANDVIIGGEEHPMNWLSTSPVFQNVKHSGPRKRFAKHTLPNSKCTFIGSDVWVGNRAIIKQGVKIGHGAIIGAGAVVTKNVPPYAIVGGVPANIIKFRFDQDTIDFLLISEWWNWSDEKIQHYAYLFADPKKLIDELKNLEGKER